MSANIDHYKALHKELIEQARDLAKQNNGSWCIRELSDIESELTLRLNEYIKMYNGEASASANIIAKQERTLQLIEERFRASPMVCY